jgi:hypothetical protein
LCQQPAGGANGTIEVRIHPTGTPAAHPLACKLAFSSSKKTFFRIRAYTSSGRAHVHACCC